MEKQDIFIAAASGFLTFAGAIIFIWTLQFKDPPPCVETPDGIRISGLCR